MKISQSVVLFNSQLETAVSLQIQGNSDNPLASSGLWRANSHSLTHSCWKACWNAPLEAIQTTSKINYPYWRNDETPIIHVDEWGFETGIWIIQNPTSRSQLQCSKKSSALCNTRHNKWICLKNPRYPEKCWKMTLGTGTSAAPPGVYSQGRASRSPVTETARLPHRCCFGRRARPEHREHREQQIPTTWTSQEATVLATTSTLAMDKFPLICDFPVKTENFI